MAKTAQQRITDTLNFLQNIATPLVAPGERTPAHQLAQAFITARFPAGAASPGYQAFANSLSLGYHLRNDPHHRRNMARALFLLWHAIRHHDGQFPFPRATIGQITQATVERQLASYIRKARCVWDETHGGHAGATQVLAVFQNAPLAFLQDNKVYVRGSGTFNAMNPQNVQPCQFFYDTARDRFVFYVGGPGQPGGAPIQVESVTAFHWTNARYVPAPIPPALHNIATANFANLTGFQLSGAHIMVTTQFTGCAFCMAENAGVMYCAHVSPWVQSAQHNTDGTTLATRVLANGQMQNAGGVAPTVFGRNIGSAPNVGGYNIPGGGGAATYMTVVGFAGGTSYQIYSQTTVNNAIFGAPTQIY